MKLWKEELFRQDIELPGVRAGDVDNVVLESQFLVVCGTSRSDDTLTSWIQVFLMEDLNSAPSLIKTIQFPDFYAPKLLCTQLVWGCLMVARDHHQCSLVLFEKTALLDAATPPEQTPRNRVHLGTTDYLVDMNTTSVVFIQNATLQENNLCKKDFWISRTTVA